MNSLSHPHVSSHTETEAPKKRRKQVRFSSCTTDIINTLFERRQFRFSNNIVHRSAHCRPILKYSEDMTNYLSTFAHVWCCGVTSDNPNVRSDMYKQLVAEIRGMSSQLRRVGESVLQANIRGMWIQLVDDFSMQREECTPKDIIL